MNREFCRNSPRVLEARRWRTSAATTCRWGRATTCHMRSVPLTGFLCWQSCLGLGIPGRLDGTDRLASAVARLGQPSVVAAARHEPIADALQRATHHPTHQEELACGVRCAYAAGACHILKYITIITVGYQKKKKIYFNPLRCPIEPDIDRVHWKNRGSGGSGNTSSRT